MHPPTAAQWPHLGFQANPMGKLAWTAASQQKCRVSLSLLPDSVLPLSILLVAERLLSRSFPEHLPAQVTGWGLGHPGLPPGPRPSGS